MTSWLHPRAVFDGETLWPDMVVAIEAGRVVSLVPLTDLPAGTKPEAVDAILSPGLFDVQVLSLIHIWLAAALDRIALPSVRRPVILKPAFGDSSGGRGAALLALQTQEGA